MYLTRGQPVVYYGDEQGFVGDGRSAADKDARQSLFATQVAEYADQHAARRRRPPARSTGTTPTRRSTTTSPSSPRCATRTPALRDGAQIERLRRAAPVYAFSRVDRDEKVEHLVALNNAAAAGDGHASTP